MKKYAVSIGVEAIDDLVKHFVFNKEKYHNSKEYYYELKQQNHPIVDYFIDKSYLASYFQINKRTLDKIEQD
jgi:hypothetical protein